jgi:carboxylesterase type B
VPFQRAIIQSPGFSPALQQAEQETALQNFLDILNVSSIEAVRALPSANLIAANAYQIATQSHYSLFTYGPAVDGTFVPALPGQLLLQGKFYQAVEVMVSSNDDKGLIFISPTDQTAAGILESIQEDFLYSNPSVIDYRLSPQRPLSARL